VSAADVAQAVLLLMLLAVVAAVVGGLAVVAKASCDAQERSELRALRRRLADRGRKDRARERGC
jgi:hypothetical protein